MKKETQKERFNKNFEEKKLTFGKKEWEENPNFLYFIEIPIETKLITKMEKIIETLKKNTKGLKGFWLRPQRMHITIALPGRMGEHFQGNDVSFMKRKLTEILNEIPPFEIQIGDLNCFDTCLFCEVLDERGEIHRLHEKVSEEIPFSQNPSFQFEGFMPHMSIYYGKGSNDFLNKEDFVRELPELKMTVNKIFFGKAKNLTTGEYERVILEEYKLT